MLPGLKTALICSVIVLSTSLGGCGGGGARTNVKATSTTVGQELMDLEKAYKDGIITEKEYHSQKKKILKRK